MAINFPANISSPYFDPISGLKYIYNNSIGAWESAQTPPAIIGNDRPNFSVPGYFWFNSVENKLYVYSQGNWNSAGLNELTNVRISATPQAIPSVGDFWWDTISGSLFIFFNDGDSSQWILASSPSSVTFLEKFKDNNQPAGSDFKQGVLWFDTSGGEDSYQVKVWYDSNVTDSTPGNWITPSPINVGLTGISGTLPVSSSGGATPVISINTAASDGSTVGTVELAIEAESTTGTAVDKVLTPFITKQTISDYLPNSSTTTIGAVELATDAETIAGSPSNRAVTPANFNAFVANPSFSPGSPIGSVVTWVGSSSPNGFLSCNGSAVSRTTYVNLFNVIGTTFGAGNGSTTFNVPDLRGYFIRGWDNGKGTDTGRTFGSRQGDGLLAHVHTGVSGSADHTVADPDETQSTGSGGVDRIEGANTNNEDPTLDPTNPEFGSGYETTGMSPLGISETRPRNVSMNYIIKF